MTATTPHVRDGSSLTATCQISALKKKNSTVRVSSGSTREIIGPSVPSSRSERRATHRRIVPRPQYAPAPQVVLEPAQRWGRSRGHGLPFAGGRLARHRSSCRRPHPA